MSDDANRKSKNHSGRVRTENMFRSKPNGLFLRKNIFVARLRRNVDQFCIQRRVT